MASKQEEAPAIVCSAAELSFLASLLGANMLLGVQDPFPGWLAYEIEEAWGRAREALSERRYLEVGADGGIVMDIGVAAIVGTSAFPDASFILTHTSADGEAVVRYFHLTSNLAVEQSVVGDEQRLAALDAAQVYERVVELCGLRDQGPAPSKGDTVLEGAVNKARVAASESGAREAEALLVQAGADPETAAALAETLAHPRANAALVALARRDLSWDVGGLGLLEGANGLWRLRSITRGDENWVEAQPCNADQARHEVRRLMNRFLPQPLAGE